MDLTAFALIARRFEGLHKITSTRPVITVTPYLCPANVLTVGYGHTGPDVTAGMSVTVQEAEQLLKADLTKAVAQTLIQVPNLVHAAPSRVVAIADFVFNLGAGRLKASTLRRRLLQEDWSEVENELRRWVYGGGKKLPGLVARREAEIALVRQAD